ncbi:MAG: hypothetical protein LC644_10645 [Pseudonocardia sp.]|nr:hypothetical protein [Pseudonocardia sp.]
MLQADIDDNGSESRLTSAEKRELAQLRRDKRRLETENQILKRAVAYLAWENLFGDQVPPSESLIAQRGSAEIDAACSA